MVKKDRQKVTSQSAESIAGKWIEIIKKNHATLLLIVIPVKTGIQQTIGIDSASSAE